MNTRLSPLVIILLVVLIAVYVGIGALYAVLTPAWQAPDEPAHYNYVRSLAEGQGFPILKQGDYDQAYLERLLSKGFPAQLSTDSLDYENHQPPLYYLLATPVYLIFDGALVPLRLLSVALGGGVLVVAFSTVRTIFPERPSLGLMAAAFIAFIPQHVAMTAAVNNDVLGELVVGVTLWLIVVYVGKQEAQPWPIGILVGIALLTKTTTYMVAGVAAAAVVVRWHREDRRSTWALKQMTWVFIPALLLAAPWFLRNALVYGWSDPLALARHEAVVTGQPRSWEWLAQYGWAGLLRRLMRTTFHSFWGQFGWMAVPLPDRTYRLLLLFSAFLAAGFVIRLLDRRRFEPTHGPEQASIERLSDGATCSVRLSRCLLLALSALFTFAAFLWYNLTFVQHQGRYLFPALIPLATAAALGLETWVSLLPRRLRLWSLSTTFATLGAFDVYALFRVILPNL